MLPLIDDDDVTIPAIVIAEYLAGTMLGPDPARSRSQRAFLDDILAVLPVHDYDRDVAEHHAALLAHTSLAGRRRGPHDLIIAATARATGRVLVTSDARAGFGELPEVTARIIG